MDSLTPPLLTALREMRWHLLAGRSVKDAMDAYLQVTNDEFSRKMRELWTLRHQGTLNCGEINLPTHYHRAFWDLLERGLLGQPIVDPMNNLEEEVERVSLRDLEMHVATLPFKALLPLLFLQFPAFIILLIGPLMRELTL